MITDFISNHIFFQICLVGGLFGLPAIMEWLLRSRIMIAHEIVEDALSERKKEKRLKKYDKIIAVLFYSWLALLFISFCCVVEWLFRFIFN